MTKQDPPSPPAASNPFQQLETARNQAEWMLLDSFLSHNSMDVLKAAEAVLPCLSTVPSIEGIHPQERMPFLLGQIAQLRSLFQQAQESERATISAYRLTNGLPVLLFRPGIGDKSEPAAARAAGFPVAVQRGEVPRGAPVIGRYSVLPYYPEVEHDLLLRQGRLLQTFQQHRYVADLGNWVDHLAGMTPATWRRIEDIPPQEQGPFVVKGATNSRKDRWKTHMLAKTRADLIEVVSRLLADTYIEEQGLYIRKFERWRTFLEGVNGQPITNEWRVFVFGGQLVCSGYYWSNYDEETRAMRPAKLPDEGRVFVHDVMKKIGQNALFYTVDIAEHEDGRWRVVELNDGQMAGLSMIEPERFYRLLAKVYKGLSPQGVAAP